jgi:hypothetical protein
VYFGCLAILNNVAPLFVRNFIVEHSGGYGALATIGVVPSYIIASVVFVIFPLAAAEHAAGRDINRFYKQAMTIGIIVTIVSMCAFAIIAHPLMSIWNKAFVPYARYLWLYTLTMGLNGIIQVIASVEMARHHYSFIWCIAVPAIIMTLTLYMLRSDLTISIVLITLLITHSVILIAIWLFGFPDIKQLFRSSAEIIT